MNLYHKVDEISKDATPQRVIRIVDINPRIFCSIFAYIVTY